MGLTHHDLCFGCGQANLFGLQLELEERDDGVAGRFFVKQDHQGPTGNAHAGVLATALEEAMSFAAGGAAPRGFAQLEVELEEPAEVGTFVDLQAVAEQTGPGEVVVTATASGPAGRLASARAILAA